MTQQLRRLFVILTWNCIFLFAYSSTYMDSSNKASIEDDLNIENDNLTLTQLTDDVSDHEENIVAVDGTIPSDKVLENNEIKDGINVILDEHSVIINLQEEIKPDNLISSHFPQMDHTENENGVIDEVLSSEPIEEETETNVTENSNSVATDKIEEEDMHHEENVFTIVEKIDESTNSRDSDHTPNESVISQSTSLESEARNIKSIDDGKLSHNDRKIESNFDQNNSENEKFQTNQQESKSFDKDGTNLNLSDEQLQEQSIAENGIEGAGQTEHNTELVDNNVDADEDFFDIRDGLNDFLDEDEYMINQSQETQQSLNEDYENNEDDGIREEKLSQNPPVFSSQDIKIVEEEIDNTSDVVNVNDEQVNTNSNDYDDDDVKVEDNSKVGHYNAEVDHSIKVKNDYDVQVDDSADIEVGTQSVNIGKKFSPFDENRRDSIILNKEPSARAQNNLDYDSQFVQGLTDFGKLLEPVDPPEEFDVGGGSSIQEVMIDRLGQIIKTRFVKGKHYIQRKVIKPIRNRVSATFETKSLPGGLSKWVKNNNGHIKNVKKFCRLVIHYVRKVMDELGFFDDDVNDYEDEKDEYSTGTQKLGVEFESLNQLRQKVMETRTSSLNAGNDNLFRDPSNPIEFYKNSGGPEKPRQISEELQNILKSRYNAKMGRE